MLYKILVSVFALSDPERILHRMHSSVQESLQMFTSYANSQVMTHEHRDLVNITMRLEVIENELFEILKKTQ